ncbi:MAG TPA: STAS domain-containing protein [Solirubrobacteraceae bacterium]|nr:STAS domain-containing protein [Solirubrobacteraceae bacterium]
MSALICVARPERSFAVEVWPDRETVCVRPVGELDLATVAELRERVLELVQAGFASVLIDLRRLSFIDVAGLRLLLQLSQRATEDGWRLSLRQGDQRVRRLFELTGTAQRLPFVGSPGSRGYARARPALGTPGRAFTADEPWRS